MYKNGEIPSDIQNLAHSFEFRRDIDKQFFIRVFSTPSSTYRNRLSALKFENMDMILDAGCGFGQWTLALSEFNNMVHAIDSDLNKIRIAKEISKSNSKNNNSFQAGSTEKLPFKNDEFDAIFSYSVIYWTDFKKSIKEFFRVLKPKGKLYFVANGLGWSIYNILTGHSSANDFNARKQSLTTIFETIKYSITKKRNPGQAIVLSPHSLYSYMTSVGFTKVIYAPEGHLSFNDTKPHSFYPKKYLGLTNVFEMWASK